MPNQKLQLWSRLQPFTREKVNKAQPKQASGVYIIYKDRKQFYVGQSNNIKGRLLRHLWKLCNKKVRAAVESRANLQFTWAEVMSYQQFEALLISHYGGRGRLANLRNESDPADRFPN